MSNQKFWEHKPGMYDVGEHQRVNEHMVAGGRPLSYEERCLLQRMRALVTKGERNVWRFSFHRLDD